VAHGLTVEKSYSKGSIKGNNNVGGVLGEAYYATLLETYSTSNLNGKDNIGGILGKDRGGNNFKDCYAKNNVVATAGTAGGFIGFYTDVAADEEIENCYAVNPTLTGTTVGGFIGTSDKTQGSKAKSSYWDKTVSGVATSFNLSNLTAIVGRTTAEMKNKSTYSGWDFNSVWSISPSKNGGYPYLRNVKLD